jgi:selenocysteine lyase/cysteine desulfurase
MPNHQNITVSYPSLFVGVDTPAPLLDGSLRRYINLDNAASTPAMKAVQEAVDAFLPYYSSVHRGTGFKSQLSTHAYEQARETVMRFLNADQHKHTCIFGKNTTEAINNWPGAFHSRSNEMLCLPVAWSTIRMTCPGVASPRRCMSC